MCHFILNNIIILFKQMEESRLVLSILHKKESFQQNIVPVSPDPSDITLPLLRVNCQLPLFVSYLDVELVV